MLKVDLSTAAMCATFVRGLGPALAQPAGLQIEGGIFYAWPLRSEQGFGRRLACYMGSFALSLIFCSWARPLWGWAASLLKLNSDFLLVLLMLDVIVKRARGRVIFRARLGGALCCLLSASCRLARCFLFGPNVVLGVQFA